MKMPSPCLIGLLLLLASHKGGCEEILHAPTLPAPSRAGDIVSLRIENNGGASQPARIVTIGQVFAEGDLPSGASLAAFIDGRRLLLQVDVKTVHPDHSAGWTILTLAAPAIAPGSHVDIMLARAEAAAAADAGPVSDKGYDLSVTVTLHPEDGPAVAKTFQVGPLVAAARAEWLDGPLAREVRVQASLSGSLTAQFDVRTNRDGTYLTRIALLNDAIFSPSSRAYRFDIDIASHGRSLYRLSDQRQAPMQEWKRTLWSDSQGEAAPPALNIVYDVAYLERTGAVPRYELSSGVAARLIAAQQNALAQADTAPLGSALVTRYEPSTGARPDIGPTTQWAADWLVSQSEAAREIMERNEAASAAAPIHARSDKGDLITTLSDPGFWLDTRNRGRKQTVDFTEIEKLSEWTPDPAHMPDLAYVTALISGRRDALDEVQAQAAYDLLAMAPAYRPDGAALVGAQQRGLAWTIRDLGNAAFLSPAGTPLKSYFEQQLEILLKTLLNHYVKGPDGAAEGDPHGYVMGAFDTNLVAPWQQGYIVIALGQAAARGVPGAAEIVRWMSGFQAGLYRNGANGYDPLNGSFYWLTMGSGSVENHDFRALRSWRQVSEANFPARPAPTALYGYPDDAIGGFSTIAKAALAVAWDTTHEAEDLAAFAFLTQHTPYLVLNVGGYASSESWNITPTLPDGHHLANNEIIWGHGGTSRARTDHALLAASSGDNVLRAGSGDSVLIGGSGKDSLIGGAGDDFLFAGTGPQSLYGGPGSNYLEGHVNGGAQADLFLLRTDDAAQDLIVGFRVGQDWLQIDPGRSGVTAAALLASATTTSAGDMILHLSPRHQAVFRSISPAQFDGRFLRIGPFSDQASPEP